MRGVRKEINYSEPCSNAADKTQLSLGRTHLNTRSLRSLAWFANLLCFNDLNIDSSFTMAESDCFFYLFHAFFFFFFFLFFFFAFFFFCLFVCLLYALSCFVFLLFFFFFFFFFFLLLFSFVCCLFVFCESLGNSCDRSRKQIFGNILGKFYYFNMKLYVVYTH